MSNKVKQNHKDDIQRHIEMAVDCFKSYKMKARREKLSKEEIKELNTFIEVFIIKYERYSVANIISK